MIALLSFCLALIVAVLLICTADLVRTVRADLRNRRRHDD
jgi:hypothetical protein